MKFYRFKKILSMYLYNLFLKYFNSCCEQKSLNIVYWVIRLRYLKASQTQPQSYIKLTAHFFFVFNRWNNFFCTSLFFYWYYAPLYRSRRCHPTFQVITRESWLINPFNFNYHINLCHLLISLYQIKGSYKNKYIVWAFTAT